MNNSIYDNYTNKYSLSKTLRFELIPQGRTQEFIERNGILDEDKERAEDYKRVKKILDEYYKDFFDKALRRLQLKNLDIYYSLYVKKEKTEKEQKEFEKIEADLRKQVVKALKDDDKFDVLFKKEIITQELTDFVQDEDDKTSIENFQNFTTYFQGFFENRKNMFSEEAKSTAVSYRIVNQNLPKYIDNIRIFDIIMSTELCEKIFVLQKELEDKLQGMRIEEFFNVVNYTHVIANSDIEIYNMLLGGRTLEDGTKIQGINEYVNLFNQKNSKDKSIRKIPKLKPLFKQILADREGMSFVEAQFENDKQVLDAIKEVVEGINENVISISADTSVAKLFKNIRNYDLDKIYITNGLAITDLSNAVYGDWSVIKTAFEKEYDEENPKKAKTKTEKFFEDRAKYFKAKKSYSLGEINNVIAKYSTHSGGVETYFESLAEKDGSNLIDIFNLAFEKAQMLLNMDYASKHGLASDKKNVAILKQLLDSIKNIEGFIKPLCGSGTEADKDDAFYGELDSIYKILSNITPLYNKVRNYVTRKPYSQEKVKLNFQNPTLLNGWDKNKERDNLAVILRKDGLYYLGIMNKKDNTSFLGDIPVSESDFYEKMEYKLLPGPNKMLPKVFFGKSNLEYFNPSEEIMEIYNSGAHKKGDNFNLEACHKLIDFFKESINAHEDWSKFGFEFSNTEEYIDISQFYREVERQGYSMNFTKIDSSYIDELVDNGKLYLFQIYNKDFSQYSKGTPNLHTIYWKMLFDEKNLEKVIYKLNGDAEVFFRKASITEENKVVHPKGQPIAKKNFKAKEQKENSLFKYDLIKDKRYTIDKYQFHVPITMNFCAESRSYINDEVIKTIRENKDINVIGIDRGERNLLYISVVNSEGRIIHQQSLNIIENDKGYSQDYHVLLDKKEHEMDSARKNWTEIESIKELKEGYLSQAIHLITELMVKYQAIVVLEDLNFGFMNGRKKVGKQVYQKFEKMLIDKLNYLVNKKAKYEDNGGALHAYQLTNAFESFAKLGKQSGFLFYIPAWNTSKIDPMTGFVNLLYPKYSSEAEAKKFIKKFDRIRYNVQEGYFEFDFKYSNFTDKAVGSKDSWTICSYGERVVNFRNPAKNSEWDSIEIDITKQLEMHLKSVGINLESKDLIESICNVSNPQFFKNLIEDIKLVLQIRNSISNTKVDYMLSPVKDVNGKFFDTRKYQEDKEGLNYFPKDADANGAYNIARKGLLLMEKIRTGQDEKMKLAITNKEWMDYAQRHTLQ